MTFVGSHPDIGLDVWLTASRHFKCALSHSKIIFRAVDVVFGKVLRIATEDTILHLISTKCISIMLYCLDASAVTDADKRSLDFAQNRLLMKLFKSGSSYYTAMCYV